MDTSTATREILWNVNSIANVVVMYVTMCVALGFGAIGVLRHAELWASGQADKSFFGDWLGKFRNLFSHGLMQKGVNRDLTPAVIHGLIYVGFLVLLFTTTMVLIDHDLGIKIYHGEFYLIVTILSDVLGFGVLIGCLLAAQRRYNQKPDRLHNKPADSMMIIVLSLLVIQGFMLEGLRIHATNDPWARYSPIGLLTAKFFWSLSENATSKLHFGMWWFHTLTVFAVAAIAPYTKFFHIIASSANLYFKNNIRPAGALKSPGDIEKLMESGEDFKIGYETIKDYSWKGLLDLDACTSCGRCQDACPAYISGKPLSPKWLILDTRNHALALHSKDKLTASFIPNPFRAIDNHLVDKFFLKTSGLTEASDGGMIYDNGGSFRANNELVQKSALKIGASVDARIAGDVMHPDVFWSCNTCMACVEACPVGINHVDQIVENRRNMVLMQGELPTEAQNTLRAIENRKNPYGPAEDRIKWLEGIDVKILKEGESVDYLYWVGCVSAFDPRKQKIARSLTKIMRHAGLDFGILGNAEGCSGDPARRLGEENLFQTMAKSNMDILKTVKFKTIIANCPHCFNTIRNEYPQFGNLADGEKPEIIHHSQLLRKLLADNKLNLRQDYENSFTFHDPCYLGRYNGEYDAPRESLTKIKGLKIVEMDKSREKGLCCGAGGGHFWMDLKIGTRVNAIRAEQAAATGAKNIATACPFCLQMMEDGVKLNNMDNEMSVKDIAEVLAENLV